MPAATLPDYMVLISEGQTDVLMEEMTLGSKPFELKSFILAWITHRGLHARGTERW